jgi:hypothetical protein
MQATEQTVDNTGSLGQFFTLDGAAQLICRTTFSKDPYITYSINIFTSRRDPSYAPKHARYPPQYPSSPIPQFPSAEARIQSQNLIIWKPFSLTILRCCLYQGWCSFYVPEAYLTYFSGP